MKKNQVESHGVMIKRNDRFSILDNENRISYDYDGFDFPLMIFYRFRLLERVGMVKSDWFRKKIVERFMP
jgi:hypothetical protein